MKEIVVEKIDSVFNYEGRRRYSEKRTSINPRMALFAKYFNDPKSESFSNIQKSALRAGYAPEYAKCFLSRSANPDNTAKKMLVFTDEQRLGMLAKAEYNLEHLLEMDVMVPAIGAFGPIIDRRTKKLVKKISTELVKIKQDTTKFVAERIGRKHYSQKVEVDAGITIKDLLEENYQRLKEYGDKTGKIGRNVGQDS